VLLAATFTQEERMREQQRGQRHGSVARRWVRHNVLTTVLISGLLCSVLLHLLTLGALVRVRQSVSRQLDNSADHLAQVRLQEVRYDVPIDLLVPLDTTIAISETVTVPISVAVPITQTIHLPIQLALPIEQTMRLPITTPIRRFAVPVRLAMTVPVSTTIEVPLATTVPVSTTVEVPIRRDVPIQAEIPIDTVLPVELNLNDAPSGDLLEHLEATLRELQNTLNE